MERTINKPSGKLFYQIGVAFIWIEFAAVLIFKTNVWISFACAVLAVIMFAIGSYLIWKYGTKAEQKKNILRFIFILALSILSVYLAFLLDSNPAYRY